MIRQGWRQGRPCRGRGQREQFSPRPQLKEGRQIQICNEIKSLSTERGGDNCGSPGPQRYNWPWAPYFTELAWGLGCASNSPTGEVIGALFRSLAIGIKTTRTIPTSDQGWINVARGSWQILARGPPPPPPTLRLVMKTFEFKDTQNC